MDWICQKMPDPIHGNPSFQNILFRETKICLKRMVLSTFLKHAISKNLQYQWIGYDAVCSWDTFLLFFPMIFNKNVFFWSLPDRSDFLLVTFQNVKNSTVFGVLMRPKKWPLNPQIEFETTVSNRAKQPVVITTSERWLHETFSFGMSVAYHFPSVPGPMSEQCPLRDIITYAAPAEEFFVSCLSLMNFTAPRQEDDSVFELSKLNCALTWNNCKVVCVLRKDSTLTRLILHQCDPIPDIQHTASTAPCCLSKTYWSCNSDILWKKKHHIRKNNFSSHVDISTTLSFN